MRLNDTREAEDRFSEIFAREVLPVTKYAQRRVPTDMVDDVVADTFLVAWRRLDEVPDPALPWLLAVARRAVANRLRGARRWGALLDRLAALPAHESFQIPDDADAPALAAFRRLNRTDQEILSLIAWEGLSVQQAAVVLGSSRGAVRTRLHRARMRLERQMVLEYDASMTPQIEGTG